MDVAVGAIFSLAAIAAVPFGVASAGVSVNTPDMRAILLLVAEQSSRACTWNLFLDENSNSSIVGSGISMHGHLQGFPWNRVSFGAPWTAG